MLIVATAWFVYVHVNRGMLQSLADKVAPPRIAGDTPRRFEGALVASGPAHDGPLGVSANAAALLRHVEMYQWHEHCEGTVCRYDTAWSAAVDSQKFREPKGHENRPAPFTDAKFFAPGLKLGDYAVEPELLAQLSSTDYAVHGANLPPNLAATFSERDGVLYAGGDPMHPAVGEMRVSYRVIPTGVVSLNGTLRAGKLVSR